MHAWRAWSAFAAFPGLGRTGNGRACAARDFNIEMARVETPRLVARRLPRPRRLPVAAGAPACEAGRCRRDPSGGGVFQDLAHRQGQACLHAPVFSDKAEDIGWQFVSEDVRLGHIRKTKPDAIKARRIPSNNFIALIDGAVATAEPREETFSDVRIDTDGEIASVSFDYAFLANGQKTNWGREMWQLVRTENGWKIFSVIYTIRDEWSGDEG